MGFNVVSGLVRKRLKAHAHISEARPLPSHAQRRNLWYFYCGQVTVRFGACSCYCVQGEWSNWHDRSGLEREEVITIISDCTDAGIRLKL